MLIVYKKLKLSCLNMTDYFDIQYNHLMASPASSASASTGFVPRADDALPSGITLVKLPQTIADLLKSIDDGKVDKKAFSDFFDAITKEREILLKSFNVELNKVAQENVALVADLDSQDTKIAGFNTISKEIDLKANHANFALVAKGSHVIVELAVIQKLESDNKSLTAVTNVLKTSHDQLSNDYKELTNAHSNLMDHNIILKQKLEKYHKHASVTDSTFSKHIPSKHTTADKTGKHVAGFTVSGKTAVGKTTPTKFVSYSMSRDELSTLFKKENDNLSDAQRIYEPYSASAKIDKLVEHFGYGVK